MNEEYYVQVIADHEEQLPAADQQGNDEWHR